jgi:hypothetical protein
MAKGGSRPGAGRPKGAINKKMRAVVEKAEAAGIIGRTRLDIVWHGASPTWSWVGHPRGDEADPALG